MKEKINELGKLILSGKFPANLRLFLITDTEYLRIYKGKVEMNHFPFGFVKGLKLDRGNILDFFSKVEFFINEIIQLKLLGFNSDKYGMLDDVLENVDLFSRIKILNDWKIIDDKLKNKFNETKKVRNGFAHLWSESEIEYQGKPIKETFPKFKSDMEEIWTQLLKIYSVEQKKIDIDKLLTEIKALNV